MINALTILARAPLQPSDYPGIHLVGSETVTFTGEWEGKRVAGVFVILQPGAQVETPTDKANRTGGGDHGYAGQHIVEDRDTQGTTTLPTSVPQDVQQKE